LNATDILSPSDLNSSFDKSFFEAKNIGVFNSLKYLADSLAKPRRILIMVPAGKAIDNAVASIKPYLEKGDILIDGGNSFFTDTDRRIKHLDKGGVQFIGMGISGEEEGAQ
jgi:6-phosphogluconate dehydrogenase